MTLESTAFPNEPKVRIIELLDDYYGAHEERVERILETLEADDIERMKEELERRMRGAREKERNLERSQWLDQWEARAERRKKIEPSAA